MFTPYTLALSDFALGGLVLSLVIIGLVLFGNRVAAYFDPLTDEDAASLRRGNAAFDSARHFNEPADEARFELPDLTETGIAAEIAGLAPGSMLVECDTAGILTPPDRLLVHVYRWTGARIEFVKLNTPSAGLASGTSSTLSPQRPRQAPPRSAPACSTPCPPPHSVATFRTARPSAASSPNPSPFHPLPP